MVYNVSMFNNPERYINSQPRRESRTVPPLASGLPYYLTLESQGLTREDINELNALQSALVNGVDDIDDAHDVIDALREYTDPIISVPYEYLGGIEQNNRIDAVQTWDYHKLLVDTLGRPPYKEDMGRALFRVKRHVRVVPRMTGPNNIFRGIVGIDKDTLVLGRDVEEI